MRTHRRSFHLREITLLEQTNESSVRKTGDLKQRLPSTTWGSTQAARGSDSPVNNVQDTVDEVCVQLYCTQKGAVALRLCDQHLSGWSTAHSRFPSTRCRPHPSHLPPCESPNLGDALQDCLMTTDRADAGTSSLQNSLT